MEYLNLTLILGVAMAAGLLSTRLMRLLNLPNVTGYLLIGLLLGPFIGHLFSAQTIADFSIISDIALGFIAFSIGCEFKLSSLKKIGSKVVIITVFQALLTAIVVGVSIYAFSRDVALALMLGAIATATAPRIMGSTGIKSPRYRVNISSANPLPPGVGLTSIIIHITSCRAKIIQ